MNEIRSNSDKARKARDKNLKPVAKGTIQKKKKTGMQKFSDIFFAEDLGTVKEYILKDVVIPLLKSTFVSIVNNATEVAVYGETSTPKKKIPGARISYDRIGEPMRRRNYSTIQQKAYDYGDAIVDTRAEAEAALETLEAVIEQYDVVSVGDLFDIIGVTPEQTDYNYGWESIANASAVRLRDGRYMLKLPRATPII